MGKCCLRPYSLSQQLDPDLHRHTVVPTCGCGPASLNVPFGPRRALGHEEGREEKPPVSVPRCLSKQEEPDVNWKASAEASNCKPTSRGSIDSYGQEVWTTDIDALTPEDDDYLSERV